jgi:hypothetical protein
LRTVADHCPVSAALICSAVSIKIVGHGHHSHRTLVAETQNGAGRSGSLQHSASPLG